MEYIIVGRDDQWRKFEFFLGAVKETKVWRRDVNDTEYCIE